MHSAVPLVLASAVSVACGSSAGNRESHDDDSLAAFGGVLEQSNRAWLDADYQTALARARDAERIARDAHRDDARAAAVQQELSILYDVGAYDDARAALDQLRRLVGDDDPDLRVNEGLLHLDAGRAALAHATFERALASAPAERSGLRRAILLNLARADIERGTPEHAVAHVDGAAGLADDDTARTAVAAYRARVANARGDGAAALAAAEAGLSAAPIVDWRWELELEAGRAAAAGGDEIGAERHYLAAIAALDEIRARHDRADFKQALLARKRSPYDALVELYAGSGRARDALAIAERARARTLAEEIAARAPSALPAAARAAHATGSNPLDHALAAVGDAVAVAYYRTARAVYRFTVRAGAIDLARLDTTPTELDRAALALRADPDDRAAAERLGSMLAPPPAPRLYLIADGALAAAPLAAARVDGRYLIERSQLALAPSLMVLAALADRPERGGKGAIVLGDPRGDLPDARREADAVARALGVEPVVGADATLARARAAADARVLHVASHAGDDGVILADGALSADAIVDAGLAPDLVVLATCAGAAPRDGGLWGSLAGSFLVAGARAVIASPATVVDADLRGLVVGFYAAGGTADPAAALASAQRTLIGRGVPASRWSSITAIGLAHTSPKEKQL